MRIWNKLFHYLPKRPKNLLRLLLVLITLCWEHPAVAEHDSFPETIPRFVLGVYLPGINDEISDTDIRVAMDYWLYQLTHELHAQETHTEFFTDMTAMAESFNRNELDMITAPALSIVKHIDPSQLGNGFKGVRKNAALNSLILLVKNDASSNDLAALAGKRLTLAADDELSEVYMDTLIHKHFHRGFKQFFSQVNYDKKNSRLILDLFFNKTDAVLVHLKTYDVMSELNPQIKKQTKILFSYPLYAKTFSFFRVNYPYSQPILNNLNALVINIRIQQMLDIFKTEELQLAYPDELLPVKNLYQEYLNLIAK